MVHESDVQRQVSAKSFSGPSYGRKGYDSNIESLLRSEEGGVCVCRLGRFSHPACQSAAEVSVQGKEGKAKQLEEKIS